MGLFSLFTENLGSGALPSRALELRSEVNEMESVIRLDWYRRVYGDGVYVGYQTLRDFYRGKQWTYKKESGTMRTYNYSFTVVENMVAFLAREAPQFTSPPTKADDVMERRKAEGRTKILDKIHEHNQIGLVFQQAARTASIDGDAFIFGAIPTYKTRPDGTKYFDSIRYWNVERPETIRVIWKDDNFREIAGFIKHYRLYVPEAKRIFKDQIAKTGQTIVPDGKPTANDIAPDRDIDQTSDDMLRTQVPMITIKEYWDEKEYLLMFNLSNKVVDYVEHNWGYVPLHYIPNIHLPGFPKGTSDLENELDAQQEYNERASDLADIIKEIARPTYWGKNLDEVSEVRAGQSVIYEVGDDAEINAMPASGQTAPMDEYLKDRKTDLIALSGMNNVMYPTNSIMQATGRALSVVMQGINNKIANRKVWWEQAFKNLNSQILMHAEKNITGAKLIIDGQYNTDVFISSVLMRDVTDEINKFNAKLQSLTTTQFNIGIPNPDEEQRMMIEELKDPVLATEIAKQPGLLEQVLAKQTAAATTPPGGGTPTTPGAVIPGAGAPQLAADENVPGSNPSPAAGAPSPVGARAAVAVAASRGNAKTVVKSKK